MNRWRTRFWWWQVAAATAALLMVTPRAVRACEDEDKDEATAALGAGRLEDEAARREYLSKVEALGSDEERSRALVRLLAEAPIDEATGAAILASAARMSADQPLYRVLDFFHEIRESDLVRGPLAGQYLDAAARLGSEDLLARALAGMLHPREIPGAAVSRALELSQRISSDEGLGRVLREVADHQALTPDIEARVRAVAERISSPEVKQRALSRLDRARSGVRHERRAFRLPRLTFRFDGEEGATPPAPPPAPDAPLPPAPPAPPGADGPRDEEVIVNGRGHRLSPEGRERIRESVRRMRERMREMSREIREQMRELRRDLRDDLGTDWQDGEMDLDLDGDD